MLFILYMMTVTVHIDLKEKGAFFGNGKRQMGERSFMSSGRMYYDQPAHVWPKSEPIC